MTTSRSWLMVKGLKMILSIFAFLIFALSSSELRVPVMRIVLTRGWRARAFFMISIPSWSLSLKSTRTTSKNFALSSLMALASPGAVSISRKSFESAIWQTLSTAGSSSTIKSFFFSTLPDRDRQSKGCPFSFLALAFDRAIMRFNYTIRNGEPQTGVLSHVKSNPGAIR